ncbi:4a-hydroxytetrahydrobiopterin dehydratase [Arthrobacter sp. USHLN218]|uniref:4a-hydroxytetrahydrobiopterin dehydratase n=1 Tax=Arthrobacter sp. USHLN218 TaxID=3081232 RepID=UPI0030162E40
MSAHDILDRTQIDQQLRTLPHWRYRQGGLVTVYKLDNGRAALDFIAAAGDLAEESNHHPDLDWRYNRVFLRLSSHDAGGEVTTRDISAAASLSELAERLGADARPQEYRSFALAADTADPAQISGLWKTALGYKEGWQGELVDPFGRGPNVWFQQTGTPAESRLHLDVYYPLSDIAPVVAAAADAGGVLDDAHAPSWTIATDADGNRICLCTEHPDSEDGQEGA